MTRRSGENQPDPRTETLFVLTTEAGYEGESVEGVFSTEAAAESAAVANRLASWQVHECPLDVMLYPRPEPAPPFIGPLTREEHDRRERMSVFAKAYRHVYEAGLADLARWNSRSLFRDGTEVRYGNPEPE